MNENEKGTGVVNDLEGISGLNEEDKELKTLLNFQGGDKENEMETFSEVDQDGDFDLMDQLGGEPSEGNAEKPEKGNKYFEAQAKLFVLNLDLGVSRACSALTGLSHERYQMDQDFKREYTQAATAYVESGGTLGNPNMQFGISTMIALGVPGYTAYSDWREKRDRERLKDKFAQEMANKDFEAEVQKKVNEEMKRRKEAERIAAEKVKQPETVVNSKGIEKEKRRENFQMYKNGYYMKTVEGAHLKKAESMKRPEQKAPEAIRALWEKLQGEGKTIAESNATILKTFG
jgi:hypothetical protein